MRGNNVRECVAPDPPPALAPVARRLRTGFGRPTAAYNSSHGLHFKRPITSLVVSCILTPDFERSNVNEIIFIVSEPPEGGYAAEALGQSIFTVAETLDELNEMVRDAVICHFEEESRPKIIRLHFVREELIAV
jgi:hypothetical protein